MIAVGQVWALNTNGERWRIEESRGNGEYLVRALDGPHEGKTDAVFGAEIRSAATLETALGPQPYVEVRTTACRAGMDGECFDADCPQLRDGEPAATGRHCPLDSGPVSERSEGENGRTDD